MNLDENKLEEIMELIKLIVNDDIFLRESLVNAKETPFYSKDELEQTLKEITSSKMKKVFEKKIIDYNNDRKKHLMEKYGKFFLSDRLIRSTISDSAPLKKKFSVFKKYYWQIIIEKLNHNDLLLNLKIS